MDKAPRLDPNGTTEATVTDEGMTLQVPNRQVARLIQLGIAADRKQRLRAMRRRQQRLARRRNRSK